jgi:uncharacterized LabA/DUF88 family protein
MVSKNPVIAPPLRTVVYVDGFNFYYGQVRGTPWKWLDLEALFRTVLGPQNKLTRVKYFTARVQPTPKDPSIHVRQDAYFRALTAHCPLIEIHYGHFLRHKITAENAYPPPNQVQIWKNEEKGSDVNLAVHMLNDAWRNLYDCAVVVSNDSDLAESMHLVRSQHKKLLGLVTPGAPVRKTSAQLKQHVQFVRRISSAALRQCQLPDPIPNTTIHKPLTW